VTLQPSIAITIQVKFDPAAVGAAAGKLTFTSTSRLGSTSAATLSGTGTAVGHQVALTWVAPTNSPVSVSGYYIWRATGASTSFQQLNASEDSQTSYVDTSVTSGTTYKYYVTSVDSQGTQSSPSNAVTVTVP
jgi:fibronectin type 3 domain-containing protein